MYPAPACPGSEDERMGWGFPPPSGWSESLHKRNGGPEGGPEPDSVTYIFVFLGSIIIYRFYKLTLSDKVQVALQLTASLSCLL